MKRLCKIWLVCGVLAAASSPARAEYDGEHKALTELLSRHVKKGVVAYDALRSDQGALERYLQDNIRSITAADYSKWGRNEQMAYLINAYNAYTLKLVLDFLPVESIRDIGAKVGGNFLNKKKKQWQVSKYEVNGKKVEFQAMGRPVSLDEIEHENLRPKFKDARVHFALVCAALSCPYLRSEAYVAARLDAQLDDQGRQFMADPFRNRYDAKSGTLYLSKIFDWFSDDFQQGGGTVAGFAKKYLPAEQGAAIKGEPKIKYLDYDWSLNNKTGTLSACRAEGPEPMADSYYNPEDLKKFPKIGEFGEDLAKKFFEYYGAVFAEGALTAREKSLIALAVSHAVQCPYCIDAYSTDCLEKGSNEAQMMEAVHVASAIRGGATLVHGVQMMNKVKKLSM